MTTGRYTQLTNKRTINGTSVSKDGKTIVLTMDAPDSATEIYRHRSVVRELHAG